MVMLTIVTVVVAISVILEVIEIYSTTVIQKRIESLEKDFDKYEHDVNKAKVMIREIKESLEKDAGVDNVIGAVSQNLLRIEQSIEGLKLGYKELACEINDKAGVVETVKMDELKTEEIDDKIYKGKAPRAGKMSFSDIEEYNKKLNEETPIDNVKKEKSEKPKKKAATKNEPKAEPADEEFIVEEID